MSKKKWRLDYSGPPLIRAYFSMERIRDELGFAEMVATGLPVTGIEQPVTQCFLVTEFVTKGFTGYHEFAIVEQSSPEITKVVFEMPVTFLEGKETIEISRVIDVPTLDEKYVHYWIYLDGQRAERLTMTVYRPRAQQPPGPTDTPEA